MKSKLLSLLIIALFITAFVNRVKAQVNAKDSFALIDFYNSTNGQSWQQKTNWLSINPVSTWYGITVQNQRVTQINLGSNLLSGTLPASIGNLDSLSTIYIPYNNLGGSIPASIGNLTKLAFFQLYVNHLSGPIPASVGRLANLQNFSAALNNLTGTIPDSIGYCRNLSFLSLNNNQLTGTIPARIKNLLKLQQINLGANQLSGTPGDVFPDDSLLQQIILSYNRFTGKIPVSLTTHIGLTVLNLSHNQFNGPIPAQLGKLKGLQDLELTKNLLTGDVPMSVITLPYFALYLYLDSNQLTINTNPSFTGKSKPLGRVQVNVNRFTFNGLEYLAKEFPNSNNLSPQAPVLIHLFHNKLAVSAGGTLSNNTYYWFKVGTTRSVTITGDSTYQPPVSGQYYAHITNSIAINLVLTTDTFNYTKTTTLTHEMKLSVYPNPVTNLMQVNGLDSRSRTKITIADMSGYVWMSKMSVNQTMISCDVSRLKAGHYLLSADDGTGIKTVAFVKE